MTLKCEKKQPDTAFGKIGNLSFLRLHEVWIFSVCVYVIGCLYGQDHSLRLFENTPPKKTGF